MLSIKNVRRKFMFLTFDVEYEFLENVQIITIYQRDV